MKKVCIFLLFIASSAWGAEWKLLKEGEDSDFFYRKESIKRVNANLYGLDLSWNISLQMEVMENFYVRRRDNDRSDYYRSVVRTNIYACGFEPGNLFRDSSLVYIQFRDSMGKGDKIQASIYNDKKSTADNWYHTSFFEMPLDVYERAWKIVCNKR
jgi:hypothetical protein